jgi:hypothetical protein
MITKRRMKEVGGVSSDKTGPKDEDTVPVPIRQPVPNEQRQGWLF